MTTTTPHTDEVLSAYIECALWADGMDQAYGPEDLAPEALESMRADVDAFLSDPDITDALDFWATELGYEQIGHDFWLTRNSHGAGFWDRFMAEPGATYGQQLTAASKPYGESYIYAADDGKVYVS